MTSTQTAPQPTTKDQPRTIEDADREGYARGMQDAIGIHAQVTTPWQLRGSIPASMVAQEAAQRALLVAAMQQLQEAQDDIKRAQARADSADAAQQAGDEQTEGWRRAVRAIVNPERGAAAAAKAKTDGARQTLAECNQRVEVLREELVQLCESLDALELHPDSPVALQLEIQRRDRWPSADAYYSPSAWTHSASEFEAERNLADGPFGAGWQLEDRDRPWIVREYAIYWHPETRVVFAHTTDADAFVPVFKLGHSDSDTDVSDRLLGMGRERQAERNSLVWAADQFTGVTAAPRKRLRGADAAH